MTEEIRLNKQQVADLLGISVPKLKRLVLQNQIHPGFSTGPQTFVGQSTRYWTYECLRLVPHERSIDEVAPVVHEKPVEIAPQYEVQDAVEEESQLATEQELIDLSAEAPLPLTDAEFAALWKAGKAVDSSGNDIFGTNHELVSGDTVSLVGPCEAVRDREAALRPPVALSADQLAKPLPTDSRGRTLHAGSDEDRFISQRIAAGSIRATENSKQSPEDADRKHRMEIMKHMAFIWERNKKERGLK